LTGFELDRVETLLRERSAEMTRTRAPASARLTHEEPSLDLPPDPTPPLEVSTVGTCADCGDRISASRLKTLPDAVRCVSCQREFEERAR
jgi:RNA polymerase-binding transcription factor DksA